MPRALHDGPHQQVNKFDLENCSKNRLQPIGNWSQPVATVNRLQPVVQLQKTGQDRSQPVHVGCGPVFVILPFLATGCGCGPWF
jgi:hypothetical protein